MILDTIIKSLLLSKSKQSDKKNVKVVKMTTSVGSIAFSFFVII